MPDRRINSDDAPDIEQLIDTFTQLPGETTREYENMLTTLAGSLEPTALAASLQRILEGDQPEPVRYAAFYTLHVLLRHKKDFTKLDENIARWESVFSGHPTFQHLAGILLIERGAVSGDGEAIERAHKIAASVPDHVGFAHLFADTVATFCEEASPSMLAEVIDEWLEPALKAADDVLRLEPRYAKFYSTKARLLAFKGEYKEADRMIRRAIDIEDSARTDYAIRIANYQFYRLSIQARQAKQEAVEGLNASTQVFEQRQQEASERINDAMVRIDSSTVRNLELLGFFAGLLSFTIGSIQIMAGQSVSDAMHLIVALMGALLVAFAGFSLLIDQRSTKGSVWRVVIVFSLGAIAIAAAASGLL